MATSVRKWVEDLPWMMQGVLFSNLRGCDGSTREDDSKILIRGYRALILMPARSKGNFLGRIPTKIKLMQTMERFVKSFDEYPTHFVLHLLHAAEIVGYKHPNFKIAALWFNFYCNLVSHMHMHIETKEQLEGRLSDDPETVKRSLKEEKSTDLLNNFLQNTSQPVVDEVCQLTENNLPQEAIDLILKEEGHWITLLETELIVDMLCRETSEVRKQITTVL